VSCWGAAEAAERQRKSEKARGRGQSRRDKDKEKENWGPNNKQIPNANSPLAAAQWGPLSAARMRPELLAEAGLR